MKNLAKLFGSYNQSCISYLSNLYISYSCSYLPLVFQFSSHFVVWLRWFHKKLQYRPIFGLEIENRRISYKWQKRKFPNKPSNLFISISGMPMYTSYWSDTKYRPKVVHTVATWLYTIFVLSMSKSFCFLFFFRPSLLFQWMFDNVAESRTEWDNNKNIKL